MAPDPPAGPRDPMPVIVGVPRSGTTLLRLMLDAHSSLAIPPETGFLPGVARYHGFRGRLRRALRATREFVTGGRPAGDLRELLYRAVTESPSWPDFQLGRDALREVFRELEPFTIPDGVRRFYALYARRFGKSRWGDKTPAYAFHLRRIEACLPEARFVHIIRDGRDVALSVRGLWFAPGSDLETIAGDWCRRIRIARRQGRRCRHYLEVRYEDLVREPPRTLQALCDFIRLPYEPAMERYHLAARARLDEHEARRAPGGRVLVTKEERLQWQRLATLPPQPSRIGRWKTEMSSAERSTFGRVAGRLLEELGYET